MSADEARGGDMASDRVAALEARIAELEKHAKKANEAEKQVSIICFSGEWDRLFAALTIACGALAMGRQVHIFFTFWGVAALRDTERDGQESERDFSQNLFSKMLPAGASEAHLSKMHFMGLGKAMLKRLMKKHNVDDIDVLLQEVKELGGHLHVCDTSSELFGLTCAELKDGEKMNRCGVATFLDYAFKSRMVLFI
jgi:peroxiredoxin family protein